MKRKAITSGHLLVAPALVLSALVFIAPFCWLVVTSFTTRAPGSLLASGGPSLDNYIRIASDIYFVQAFLRTILMSLAATVLCLFIAFPVGRFIVVHGGAMKGVLLALMLVPLVSGALLPSIGMVHLLSPLGLVNGLLRQTGLITGSLKLLGSMTGIVIGLVQSFLPLMLLPLVNTLSRLPRDVEAAAATLGAPPTEILRRIVLPLAAPGIAAGSTLVFCACLTSFVTPQILGQGKIATFGTVAYQQAAQVLDWPFASALAVVMLVLLGLAGSILPALARRASPAGVSGGKS